jgi:hypothetical protein
MPRCGLKSPLKRLIPLVREVTKLRVVFEINVGFSDTKCKTLTRIHWDRRFADYSMYSTFLTSS